MPKNPKLETSFDENVKKYTYKPYYTIKNRKDLINLIKDHQTKGLGGILMDDVVSSRPCTFWYTSHKRLPSSEWTRLIMKRVEGTQRANVPVPNDCPSRGSVVAY